MYFDVGENSPVSFLHFAVLLIRTRLNTLNLTICIFMYGLHRILTMLCGLQENGTYVKKIFL